MLRQPAAIPGQAYFRAIRYISASYPLCQALYHHAETLPSMPLYLFVLCPPYSGSTLLWKLLATSPNVSAMPTEGQFLPELKDIMRSAPWKRDQQLPWPEIRAVWHSYWDMGKPVLLEKSPPNLIRTGEIVAHFQPSRFIVLVRNPYAQAEGLMRRNGWSAQRAARFALMCLRAQRDNALTLENSLATTYEALVTQPDKLVRQLLAFVPELGSVDETASFEIHSVDGTLDRPITDLNKKKIASLAPGVRADISAVLAADEALLDFWGYGLIS